MQSKEELEAWYKSEDPWSYRTNPDDQGRKERILHALPGRYKRALDIGAGEGWITQDLSADEIHGLEISDEAASRFPKNVKRVSVPVGKYDLVLATGVLYRQYDNQQVLNWISKHASKIILVAGIKDWLVDLSSLGEPVYVKEFSYREYTQEVRVYKCK
jgi:hypothetical protein